MNPRTYSMRELADMSPRDWAALYDRVVETVGAKHAADMSMLRRIQLEADRRPARRPVDPEPARPWHWDMRD